MCHAEYLVGELDAALDERERFPEDSSCDSAQDAHTLSRSDPSIDHYIADADGSPGHEELPETVEW
jgi:hypothetical protein